MPDEPVAKRVETLERILNLQRLKGATAETAEGNSNNSELCGNSFISDHCGGAALAAAPTE